MAIHLYLSLAFTVLVQAIPEDIHILVILALMALYQNISRQSMVLNIITSGAYFWGTELVVFAKDSKFDSIIIKVHLQALEGYLHTSKVEKDEDS